MKMAQFSRIACLAAAAAVLTLLAAPPASGQNGEELCPVELLAVIGPVAPMECASTMGTDVQLDGTGSSVGTNITYLWTTSNGAVFDDDTSLTPIGTFEVGVTQVTLTVTCTDVAGMVSVQAMADVVIEDTTPPTISAMVDKTCLWPPNHKYHKINATVEAEDTCDPDPVIALDSVVSNEPDDDIGDGSTTEDILLNGDGSMFQLRSERQGPGSGRVYTATYSATDASGNFATDSVMIMVPHDMGNVDNRLLCKSSNNAAKLAQKLALKTAKEAAKAEAKANKSNNGKAKGKNK